MIIRNPTHIEDVENFLAHGHRRRYPAKSTIIYAGDKADTLYYVVKGTVCVLVEDTKNRKEMIVCLLYTSPSPRDRTRSRMPSSA